jgi:predicted  nucleic acid-binding Zn-ribbon protein
MITSWQERFNNKFQHSAIQAGKNSWQVKFMQEEIDELRAEGERLEKQLFNALIDTRLDKANDEIERLTKENNWLQEHAGVIK